MTEIAFDLYRIWIPDIESAAVADMALDVPDWPEQCVVEAVVTGDGALASRALESGRNASEIRRYTPDKFATMAEILHNMGTDRRESFVQLTRYPMLDFAPGLHAAFSQLQAGGAEILIGETAAIDAAGCRVVEPVDQPISTRSWVRGDRMIDNIGSVRTSDAEGLLEAHHQLVGGLAVRVETPLIIGGFFSGKTATAKQRERAEQAARDAIEDRERFDRRAVRRARPSGLSPARRESLLSRLFGARKR